MPEPENSVDLGHSIEDGPIAEIARNAFRDGKFAEAYIVTGYDASKATALMETARFTYAVPAMETTRQVEIQESGLTTRHKVSEGKLYLALFIVGALIAYDFIAHGAIDVVLVVIFLAVLAGPQVGEVMKAILKKYGLTLE